MSEHNGNGHDCIAGKDTQNSSAGSTGILDDMAYYLRAIQSIGIYESDAELRKAEERLCELAAEYRERLLGVYVIARSMVKKFTSIVENQKGFVGVIIHPPRLEEQEEMARTTGHMQANLHTINGIHGEQKALLEPQTGTWKPDALADIRVREQRVGRLLAELVSPSYFKHVEHLLADVDSRMRCSGPPETSSAEEQETYAHNQRVLQMETHEQAEQWMIYVDQIRAHKEAYLAFARDLTERNLPRVLSVAKKMKHPDASYIDTVTAGNFGLLKSVQSYDYSTGWRFSTYSENCIKNDILGMGRESKKKAHEVNFTTYMPESDEAALGLYDNRHGDPAEVLFNSKRRSTDFVHKLIKIAMDGGALDEREQKILNARYGLDGPEMTLKECGERHGITKERIRQIEARALEKLLKIAETLPEAADFALQSE